MSRWSVRFDKRAVKDLQRLSSSNRERVRAFIDDRLPAFADPRTAGRALAGSFAGLWRYRVGNIRIVVQIRDRELVILVVAVAQRGEVYR